MGQMETKSRRGRTWEERITVVFRVEAKEHSLPPCARFDGQSVSNLRVRVCVRVRVCECASVPRSFVYMTGKNVQRALITNRVSCKQQHARSSVDQTQLNSADPGRTRTKAQGAGCKITGTQGSR